MAETKPPAAPSTKSAVAPEGKITNRPDGAGTIQQEPRPEDLPSDAKIAPIEEQLRPNAASQAVGARQTEGEGLKLVEADMSSASAHLPDDTEQDDAARRAEVAAKLRSDEGKRV